MRWFWQKPCLEESCDESGERWLGGYCATHFDARAAEARAAEARAAAHGAATRRDYALWTEMIVEAILRSRLCADCGHDLSLHRVNWAGTLSESGCVCHCPRWKNRLEADDV